MERNTTCMCHEDIQAHMQEIADSLIGKEMEVYCQDDRCPEHLWEIFHWTIKDVCVGTDSVLLHFAADCDCMNDEYHRLPFNKLACLVESGTTKIGPDEDSTIWWSYKIMDNQTLEP